MRYARYLVLLLALFSSACCSVRGEAPFPEGELSPEQAVANARFFVEKEAWSELYDLLSSKTRDEYSRIEFRLGVPGAKLPGTEVDIRTLFLRSQTLSFVPNGENSKELLWLMEDPDTSHKNCHLFQILLLHEQQQLEDLPKGSVWRFGLQDQIDRQIPLCAE